MTHLSSRLVSRRLESAMDRESSWDNHVQHRALFVQQVRLCYRRRSLHGRSYPGRGHRGAKVGEVKEGCQKFHGRGLRTCDDGGPHQLMPCLVPNLLPVPS